MITRVILSIVFTLVWVHTSRAVTQPELDALIPKLQETIHPSISLASIENTVLDNLYSVKIGSDVIYITKDGNYLLAGDIYDLNQPKTSWNLTATKRRLVVKDLLHTIDDAKPIILKPSAKKKVGRAYVFTDPSCKYSAMLQKDVDSYSKAGIELAFVAYPNGGDNSVAYKKANAIWCAKKDQIAKLNAVLVDGKELPALSCDIVKTHIDLGLKFGINATPTMILSNGKIIRGLLPAEKLIQEFDNA